MTTRRTLFGLGAGLAAAVMGGAGAIARTLTKPHKPPKGVPVPADAYRADLDDMIGLDFPDVGEMSAKTFVSTHLGPALEAMMQTARLRGMEVRYLRASVENGLIRIDALSRDEQVDAFEAFMKRQRANSAG